MKDKITDIPKGFPLPLQLPLSLFFIYFCYFCVYVAFPSLQALCRAANLFVKNICVFWISYTFSFFLLAHPYLYVSNNWIHECTKCTLEYSTYTCHTSIEQFQWQMNKRMIMKLLVGWTRRISAVFKYYTREKWASMKK